MMNYFAELGPDGYVVAVHSMVYPPLEGQDSAPIDPGNSVEQLAEMQYLAQPTETSKAIVQDGLLVWVETASLEEVKAVAIGEIDQRADAARLAVVGDAARIKEYERAQAGAEAYRDAGFTGAVPPGVASWAFAKRRQSWTARDAAEDILAASARWYAALDGIRALRLDSKEAIRFAVTKDEVVAIASTFRSTLTAAMQGVQ